MILLVIVQVVAPRALVQAGPLAWALVQDPRRMEEELALGQEAPETWEAEEAIQLG